MKKPEQTPPAWYAIWTRSRHENVVREQLERVAHDYGADEVMVVTITFDHAARRKSYELLAAEFGLG